MSGTYVAAINTIYYLLAMESVLKREHATDDRNGH